MGNAFPVCTRKSQKGETAYNDCEKKSWKFGGRCKKKEVKGAAQPELKSWDKKILDQIAPSEYKHTQAAIWDVKDQKLLSSVPETFLPTSSVMVDVEAYFDGDSCRLEVGQTLNVVTDTKKIYTVEKIEEVEGKEIHCKDGKKGGCSIIRADPFLLVVVYDQNLDKGVKLAKDLAGKIDEHAD